MEALGPLKYVYVLIAHDINQLRSIIFLEQKVEEEEEEKKKTVHIKLPTKDQEVWADERIFDRELHIRVYQPEGLDCRDLKCAVNFGPDMWKTDILDVVLEEVYFMYLFPEQFISDHLKYFCR